MLELEPRPTTKCAGAGSLRRQSAALRLVGHDRQSTRLVEPPRQVLLSDACLSSQLRCTHCVLSSEPMDHLLLEGNGVWLAHLLIEFSPPSGSTSTDATTTLTGPEWSVAHKIMRLLKSKDLLSDERMELLLSLRNSGFSVDASPTVWPQDTQGLERLCRYLLRCPSASHAFTGRPVPGLCSTKAKTHMMSLCCPIPKERASTFSSSSHESSPRFQSLENTAFTNMLRAELCRVGPVSRCSQRLTSPIYVT